MRRKKSETVCVRERERRKGRRRCEKGGSKERNPITECVLCIYRLRL